MGVPYEQSLKLSQLPPLPLDGSQVPIPMLHVDAALQVSYVNRAARTELGLSHFEEGQSLFDVVPYLAPALVPLCQKVLTTNETLRATVGASMGDRHLGFPSTICFLSPLLDAGAQSVGVAIALVDISRERRAEQKLHDYTTVLARSYSGVLQDREKAFSSTKLLWSILESIKEPVVVVFKNGELMLNPQARSLFGLTFLPNEPGMERISGSEVIPPWLMETIPFDRAREGERIEELELSVMNPARREVIHFACSVQPLANGETRELLGGILVLWDISERKKLEKAKRETSEELGRSNRELEQFAITASHDLAAPLRTITTYLKLLDKSLAESIPPDSREMLNFALEGSTRMRKLLDGLFKYACVGMKGLGTDTADLKRIAEEVVKDLSSQIAEIGASVEIGFLPILTGDSVQITQVFQNLFANALKFHSKERLRISASAVRINETWLVQVRDNGIGMPKTDIHRVFELFNRGNVGPDTGGTGVGLAVVRKIVERHGGRVWVESEEGKGSTFSMIFPG